MIFLVQKPKFDDKSYFYFCNLVQELVTIAGWESKDNLLFNSHHDEIEFNIHSHVTFSKYPSIVKEKMCK